MIGLHNFLLIKRIALYSSVPWFHYTILRHSERYEIVSKLNVGARGKEENIMKQFQNR